MLDTFKARLKAKTTASGVNLSKERIAALADRLHKKFPDLTEEADHDKEVDYLDELLSFADIAKEDDRVRTLEKKLNEPKPADPKPADPKPTPPTDEPAWFKAYREAQDAKAQELEAKLSSFEKEKAAGTIKQKLSEQLKDLPNNYWSKRMLPEKEEELEAFVAEVKQDWTNDGLANQTKPGGGSGGAGNGKATNEEIKSIVDKAMPK